MSPLSPSEREWLDELTHSWVEVYKKSATTLVLLRTLRSDAPTSVPPLREHFTATTGWSISERGLYRTLKRLADAGLLATHESAVPGTGAKRKDFALTEAGAYYLNKIESQLVE